MVPNAMDSQSFVESMASSTNVCTQCGSIMSLPRCVHRLEKLKAGHNAPSAAIKRPRRKYKERKKPEMLRLKEARADLKVSMIALIPGVSRVKAEAVLSTCEGSMAQLVGASSTKLARVVCKGSALGEELGVAIWRALH
jgi:ERCC4-type nuclease